MPKSKFYFWEKLALKPEKESDDSLNFYEVEDDVNVREVIRNLESKIIGKKLLFSDISPNIPVVKKWINEIRDSYPDRKDEIIESLLDTFRGFLYPRSKERFSLIVGVLLLNDVLLLVHCKKDPSLAEMKDKIYSVKLILHPKNVLRAAIIKNENGKNIFSAFEYSRKWSKGHAEFWEIEPEDVSWESLGSISLTVEINGFPYPIQLPIESEQLGEMIANRKISPMGKIMVGREEGKIIQVEVFRKSMDFIDFYDYYITETEKLEEHRKRFKELLYTQQKLSEIDQSLKAKYKYEETSEKIFEITPEGNIPIHNKKHPRYTVCFFTNDYPRIKPNNGFIFTMYQSIFENNFLEIWHAGEETDTNPVKIGSLNIYNKISFNQDIDSFSNNLLNIIQDAGSKKKRLLLQYAFCNFWKKNTKNKHFSTLFNFLIDSIISPELEFEFKNEGICDNEGHLEFKSADDVSAKTSRFARDVLIPAIRKYTENGKLSRYCLLYGIEDNGKIKPLHHLANDQIGTIEKIVNETLLDQKIQISVQSIPFKEGLVLSVFIIPLIGMVEKSDEF